MHERYGKIREKGRQKDNVKTMREKPWESRGKDEESSLMDKKRNWMR